MTEVAWRCVICSDRRLLNCVEEDHFGRKSFKICDSCGYDYLQDLQIKKWKHRNIVVEEVLND